MRTPWIVKRPRKGLFGDELLNQTDDGQQHAAAYAASGYVAEIYKWRHLIENFFGKLKEFKRITMRSDKTDESFEAMTYACAAPKAR